MQELSKTELDIKLYRVVEYMSYRTEIPLAIRSLLNIVEIFFTDEERSYTDGTSIFLTKELLTKSPQEIAFTIAHECGHIIFNHFIRGQGLIHLIFNYATDYWINDGLEKVPNNVMLIGDLIINAEYDSDVLSEEEIYYKLLNQTPQKNVLWLKFLSGIDLSEAEQSEVEQMIKDALKEQGDLTDHSKWKKPSSEFNDAVESVLCRVAGGNCNNSFDRKVQTLIKNSKYNWKRALRSLIGVCFKREVKYDWRVKDRRNRSPVFEPNRITKKRTFKCLIVFDTSGSISKDILQEIKVEALAISHVSQVDIISVDTNVYNIKEKCTANDVKNYVPRGGGGTNFSPAFEFASDKNYNLIIYFTDGCGNLNEKYKDKFHRNTVWCIMKGGIEVTKFGKNIFIK